MPPQLSSRRQTRRKFLAGLAILGLGGPAYARYMEPTWLDVGQYEVKCSTGGNRTPLKILHLSDLHASPVVALEFIAEAIQLGLSFTPDLICVTGDFLTRKYDELDRYARILSALPAKAPTFACLGNHDGGLWAGNHGGYKTARETTELLARSRIELLHNSARTVQIADWSLQLVGVSDLWGGEFSPPRAFSQARSGANTTTVVLAHNPDSKDRLKFWLWDLMLSGHTHGGQFSLPLIGTPFAPVQDKRFIKGLYRWEDRWLHITKGVGNVLGWRFNCRPEISLLTLI